MKMPRRRGMLGRMGSAGALWAAAGLLFSAWGSEPAAPQSVSKGASSEYRIRPGDLITLWVYKASDFNLDLRVSPAGKLRVPLVGELDTAGRKLDQLAAEIRKGLMAKAKLRNPQVSLMVKEFAVQRAYILGSVKEPKAIELPVDRPMTITQAIAVAGGLSGDALPQASRVTRQRPDGTSYEIPVDLSRLAKGGRPELNLALQPGDSIFVPNEGGVFVLGAVKNPGYYDRREAPASYKRQALTASQAVALADGLVPGAIAEKAKIIRRGAAPKDNPEVIPVDVRALITQGQPGADVRLHPGDTLLIPKGEGIYVLGNVRKGGVFYPSAGERLTVTKALSLAGSFEKFAKLSSVRVIRKDGVRVIDVKKLTEKRDLSEDLELNPGDVVFVPKGF